MLLSLISVLVLLVVAFYAVWVAVMGRVNGNEGPELTVGGRALAVGIALVAFGAAYLVYSQPRNEALVTADLPAAMPSNPPESRGSTTEVAASPAPAAEPEKPASEKDGDLPEAGSEAAITESEVETNKAIAAEQPVTEKPAADNSNEGLSASAAQLEADRAESSSQPAKVEPATVAAVASKAKQPVEASRVDVDTLVPRVSSEVAPPVRSARARNARNSLVLHVQNALGRDQQREQLTLSIEGKAVADIEVNDQRPTVAVAVPLPRPGLLHYRLEGVSESDGSTRLVGEGCIRVRDGARFAVRRRDGSSKVFLETARVAG